MVHTVYFFVRKDILQNAKHCYTTVFIYIKVVYRFVLTITMLRSGMICFFTLQTACTNWERRLAVARL